MISSPEFGGDNSPPAEWEPGVYARVFEETAVPSFGTDKERKRKTERAVIRLKFLGEGQVLSLET